jgi:hypothetical protein
MALNEGGTGRSTGIVVMLNQGYHVRTEFRAILAFAGTLAIVVVAVFIKVKNL